jgi:hypothetical protein
LFNVLDNFCQEDEQMNRKGKKKVKTKGRNSTLKPAVAPIKVERRKKRSIIARNNNKKGSISVFPGGYHISKYNIRLLYESI